MCHTSYLLLKLTGKNDFNLKFIQFNIILKFLFPRRVTFCESLCRRPPRASAWPSLQPVFVSVPDNLPPLRLIQIYGGGAKKLRGGGGGDVCHRWASAPVIKGDRPRQPANAPCDVLRLHGRGFTRARLCRKSTSTLLLCLLRFPFSRLTAERSSSSRGGPHS